MRRPIYCYYGFQLFFGLLFWVPVFYEFQKQIGLSDTQIFAIQSAYYIAFALMEIPTGLLADRWGYKFSMRWGSISLIAANLLPIFMQNYSGFFLHFMLIALSRSLISGASSAYLYEYLNHHQAANDYKRIEGRARSISLIAKVACWSIVGLLMTWHLTLPYWLTVGSSSLALLFVYLLPPVEEQSSPPKIEDSGLLQRVMGLVTILRHSPVLLIVMLQGVAVFVLVRILQVNLFQPILGGKDFSLESYGIIMAVMTLFEATGSSQIKLLSNLIPRPFRKFKSDASLVSILSLIMGAAIFAIPFANQYGTIACFAVFSFASGTIFPIQRQLMNDQIHDPHYRATLLSIESIIDRVVCAFVAHSIGNFLTAGRLDDFLVYASVGTVILIGVIFIAFRLVYRNSCKAGE